MSRPVTEVLVFALDGMRFALPAAGVVEQLVVDGDRLRRLARLAETGVLGASGLPLLRLSSRLGIGAPAQLHAGSLLLVGEAGRVRGTVLLDAEPVTTFAELRAMPATVPDAPARQAALVAGIAVLPAGERAILLQIPTGILRESAPEVSEPAPRALIVAPAGARARPPAHAAAPPRPRSLAHGRSARGAALRAALRHHRARSRCLRRGDHRAARRRPPHRLQCRRIAARAKRLRQRYPRG